jgi:hypothetical protein
LRANAIVVTPLPTKGYLKRGRPELCDGGHGPQDGVALNTCDRPRKQETAMSKVRNENLKPAKEMTELSIAELSAVTGGRMDAQHNSRSANPIDVSRDRALNG